MSHQQLLVEDSLDYWSDQVEIYRGSKSIQIDEGEQNQLTYNCQDTEQEQKDNNQDGDTLMQQQRVSPSQNNQNFVSYSCHSIDRKIKKNKHKNFPSETKNLGKNFANSFKIFLNQTLSSKDKTQYSIRKFLKSSSNEQGLQNFRNQIKNSKHLTQLAEYYFGQLGWARTFMQNNKTDLSLFYRHRSILMSQEE